MVNGSPAAGEIRHPYGSRTRSGEATAGRLTPDGGRRPCFGTTSTIPLACAEPVSEDEHDADRDDVQHGGAARGVEAARDASLTGHAAVRVAGAQRPDRPTRHGERSLKILLISATGPADKADHTTGSAAEPGTVGSFAARQRSRDAVEVVLSTVLLSLLLVLLLVGASMDRRSPSPRTSPDSAPSVAPQRGGPASERGR